MKLSVILPCFNGAATIAVQLEALTRQSWSGKWEVVVVNNGSTDHSMEIVEQYRDRLPPLKIVNAYHPPAPRLGVPHSYNVGIAAATGDAFVFCEADDEVAPGWLSAMGKALQSHDFVVARLDHRKLNPTWLHPSPNEGDGQQSAGLSQMHVSPFWVYGSGCSFGLRRSLYETVGQFNPDFPCGHDVDYCWRVQLAGYRIHFESSAVIHYRDKSEYPAMYRQGRNWGRDFTLLLKHYQFPLGRIVLLRQILLISQKLLQGIKIFLYWILKFPQAQQQMGRWIWSMGWITGQFLGILQKPPTVRRKVAIAVTTSTETKVPVRF